MKAKLKKPKSNIARNSDEIGDLLELNSSEKVLMKHKAEITRIAIRAIEESDMTVNEIVQISGVARSKVSAVKNGATVSVSIDLLIKIIAATGTRLTIHAA